MSENLRAVVVALVVTLLLFGVMGGGFLLISSRQITEAQKAELSRRDEIAKAHLVDSLDRIRAELGRVPRDIKELEELWGEPMPKVHDNGVEVPIFYHRLGDDHFLLQYELWATDDWVFDSDKPDAGWVQKFY